MYYNKWIQRGRQAPIHSYESTRDSSSSVFNSSRAGYFLFPAPLARTGIKLLNLAALLDFPNVIRPNETNPDGATSNVAEVWT